MNYREKAPALWDTIKDEEKRQEDTIELIASENTVSDAVREAQGSMLTNKHAEGYPGKRYYGRCQYVDQVEQLAIDYAKKLFNAEYANVQPHSGSQADMTVYNVLLKSGDTILGMGVDAGRRLTHGSGVNFSGKTFNSVSYGLNPETEELDFGEIRQIALENKPKLIIIGASAYSRIIDWQKFREIADKVGAHLMADMAHIAGLTATGAHPGSVPVADVVTTATRRTLRGPRDEMILSNNRKSGKEIDSALSPSTQGGPLEHVIAARTRAFYEDLQPEFSTYIEQVVKNTQAMADEFKKSENIRVVSGGVDNHSMIVGITKTGVAGKDTQNLLDPVNIITDKESTPGDTRSPFITNGLRIGTPAITSRGFKESDTREAARIIIKVLDSPEDKDALTEAKSSAKSLVDKHQIK